MEFGTGFVAVFVWVAAQMATDRPL